MSIKINELEKSRIEIIGELNWLEFKEFFDKARKELAENLEIKGFRPGKAPQELIDKRLPAENILSQAAQKAIEQEYRKAVQENNLEPIIPPQAEILKMAENNPFAFRIRVDVLPEIILPDYLAISQTIKKQEVKTNDQELEQALNWLRQSRAEFKELKRPAQDGDFVEISYQSPDLENNKEYKDGFVLGQGKLVPGFEENIIGSSAGDKKEFQVDFPQDYFKKELAGKKVDISLKLEKVSEMILPELTDDFVKALGKFNNLDELRKSIKQGMRKEKEQAELNKRRADILDKICEQVKVEIPETLFALEKERTKDEADDEQIKKRIKVQLVLRAIGQKEKIEVSDDEAEQAANQFLASYPQLKEDKDKVDPKELIGYYKSVVFNQKIFNKICPQ